MEFLPREGYKRVIYITVYIIIGAAALWLFFKFALPVILPFVIGWLLAAAFQRPAVFIHKKTRVPKIAVAAVLTVAVIFVFSVVIFALISVIIRNGGEIISKISKERDDIGASLSSLFEKLGKFFEKFGVNYDGGIPDVISNALTSVASSLTSLVTGAAARFAAALPHALIFFAATVMSSIYFCAEYRGIADYVLKKLPPRLSSGVSAFKREFGAAMIKYVKSYSLIFLITFGELSVGLAVAGVNGAVIWAALIALVDVLPVLGAGAVLVPWAIIEFILGNTVLGISLAAIYGVISLVRQIIEPRIVGKGIGLHPAVSLIAMYAGLRMFGLIGMIFAPLAVAIIRNTAVAIRGKGS